ncbi:MAG: TlpA family protein disulfide reductase [Acidobacteria bacterium]|nr:TlpA family protein disulfide reductase [Acidobacteriota bacterium]
MRLISLFVLSLAFVLPIAAQNEQSPIVDKDIKYQNWKYPTVRDISKELDLRELSAGKKLVVVVYFAPWCPNWRFDAPKLEAFYKKYQAQGLEIVGVGEYDPVDSMKTNLTSMGVTFPVVYESVSRAQRGATKHSEYRKETGDKRYTGSPWYILLDPSKYSKDGDTLVKRADVINGEMIMTEGEAYIRKALSLTAESAAKKPQSTATAAIEACDPSKPAAIKKP